MVENNKRIIHLGFSVLLLLFLSHRVAAQEFSHTGKFNFGVEGGVQFTNMNTFLSPFSSSSKTGFYAGFFGEYNLSSTLTARLGLQYDNRGFLLDGYTPLADSSGSVGASYYVYQADYTINYLTIPLNINYLKGSDRFKVAIQAGVYFSFLLNTSLDGVEAYFIDQSDDLDLSATILHTGANEFILQGSTEGLQFVDISNEKSTPDEFAYKVYKLKNYDVGLNLFVGLLYQATPSVGFNLAPGFSYSLTQAFEDPDLSYKWQQMVRINAGIIYTINVAPTEFGEAQK